MSEKTSKTVFHFFLTWNVGREERWLEEMAGSGWHLAEVKTGMFFHFEKGEPRNMVYRLDYTGGRKIDRDEYFGIFKAAGWEHAAAWANWEYFRIPKGPGPSPEIFTDRESRISKYKRILAFLFFFFAFGIWNAGNLLRSRARYGWIWDAAIIFQLVTVVLLGYGVFRLVLVIRKIKQGPSREDGVKPKSRK
jgi:hypothetical protein